MPTIHFNVRPGPRPTKEQEAKIGEAVMEHVAKAEEAIRQAAINAANQRGRSHRFTTSAELHPGDWFEVRGDGIRFHDGGNYPSNPCSEVDINGGPVIEGEYTVVSIDDIPPAEGDEQ